MNVYIPDKKKIGGPAGTQNWAQGWNDCVDSITERTRSTRQDRGVLERILKNSRRAETNMFVQFEKINEKRAAELLKLNTNNRNIKDQALSAYMRDMKHGRWKISGSTIVIREDGVIADGAHRLTAIVKTGIPIYTFVVYNAPTDGTYDVNVPRTTNDIIKISDIISDDIMVKKNGSTVKKYMNLSGHVVGGEKIGIRERISPFEIEKFMFVHEDWMTALDYIWGKKTKREFNRVYIGISYLSAIRSGISVEKLKEFHSVLTGDGCTSKEEDYPVIMLRDWMNKHQDRTDEGLRERIYRTQYAIREYVNGTCIRKTKNVGKYIFPIDH